MSILDAVKKARRITTDYFDDEIVEMINAAIHDLGIVGIRNDLGSDDPLIRRAIITYCMLPVAGGDYDRYKRSYDEQKAQLQMSTGYTNWGDQV